MTVGNQSILNCRKYYCLKCILFSVYPVTKRRGKYFKLNRSDSQSQSKTRQQAPRLIKQIISLILIKFPLDRNHQCLPLPVLYGPPTPYHTLTSFVWTDALLIKCQQANTKSQYITLLHVDYRLQT